MALTPEQLRMAISGYRGQPMVTGPQPAPIDPALMAPIAPPPVQAPVVAVPPVVAPPPIVAPMPATVAQPRTYRAGVQQALNAYRGATGEAVQVAKAAGEAKAADATAKAGIMSDRVDQLDADTGPDRTASMASKATADDLFKQYQSKQAEVENTKVTRDRRSDGQRTADVVAAAFAGIGDALSNFGNARTDTLGQMQATIQDEIQRDVDDQRAALNDKRASADATLTEYGIARQILGDDKDAENKAYEWAQAKASQRFAAAIEAQGAKSGSTLERLAAEAMAAQLKGQAAQTELGLWQGLEQNRVSASRGPSVVVSPELQYRMMRDQQEDARNPVVMAQEQGAQLTGDLVVRDSKVAPVHAKNAEKIQATVDAAKNAIATIDLALQLRADNPVARSLPLTDANAQLGNLQGDLDIALKTIQDLGVLAGPDMALIRGQTGDATGITGSNDVKLRQLRDNIARKVGQGVYSRGFEIPPELVTQSQAKSAAPDRTVAKIKAATKPKEAPAPQAKADTVGGDDW